MRRRLPWIATAALAATLLAASPAFAGPAWDDVHAHVFAGRAIQDAGDVVQLSAPGRPTDQRAVPIAVEAKLGDGRTIRAVTLIVDENPTPVAAVFDIGGKRDRLKLATTLRLNTATDVRAIVAPMRSRGRSASMWCPPPAATGARRGRRWSISNRPMGPRPLGPCLC